MIFEAPFLLALAPLLAVALGALAWVARRRRVAFATAWSAALGRAARSRIRRGPLAVAFATLCAGIALAGPRGGRAKVTAETHALNLVLAVDISRSMLAEDANPNRLQHAVRESRRLVQDIEGDRVGLIAFAGRSYILTPLTVDGSAVRMYLDGLDPDLASEGGTSLSAVLQQGGQLLAAGGDGADRVLVVFTDGEGHDSLPEAVAQAQALRSRGVHLILVAEGRAAPVRIPIRDSTGTLIEYKLDEQGQPVRTQRRDDILRALGDAAEATVVPADLPDQAGAIKNIVAAFKRSPISETRVADLVPRGWIPALAAVLALLGFTLAGRGAALAALAGIALLGGSAQAQRPTRGDRALAAGDPVRAAQAWLEQAGLGTSRDTAFYNAGTAAASAGKFDVARGALTEAAKSADPELRYRALYNLGTAALDQAARDSARRDALLDEATGNLRSALLLEPASARAKWNLELALRRRPPQSGGGGGGGSPPSGGGGAQRPKPAEPAQGPQGLSQTEAEQILNSMERQERATRAEQESRFRGGAGGVKDW
ncbi:MAG TPA: VWA domain-containing protein [Thermoanaerobaculia bacterium]|nr:VWA domain-containing protein [Thermoanaerobaculia bacterium]